MRPRMEGQAAKKIEKRTLRFGFTKRDTRSIKRDFFRLIEWARWDLNPSLWLPKPQGYQATPRALKEGRTDDFKTLILSVFRVP